MRRVRELLYFSDGSFAYLEYLPGGPQLKLHVTK